MGQPNNLSSHPPQLSTGVSQCVAPHSGEVGSNWGVLSGGLPRWALGPSAPDLCGVLRELEIFGSVVWRLEAVQE